MKLLIIFDKTLNISPEKICVHTGHACRFMGSTASNQYLKEWAQKHYKIVLLHSKITEKLINRIQSDKFYEIRDAGLDGVFEPNTLLGYAVLVEDGCDDFKRLQTLNFKNYIGHKWVIYQFLEPRE